MQKVQISDVVKSGFLRRLERPVSLIIAAQNLRLSACFDTMLQTDEVGIILKIINSHVGVIFFEASNGNIWYSNYRKYKYENQFARRVL